MQERELGQGKELPEEGRLRTGGPGPAAKAVPQSPVDLTLFPPGDTQAESISLASLLLMGPG